MTTNFRFKAACPDCGVMTDEAKIVLYEPPAWVGTIDIWGEDIPMTVQDSAQVVGYDLPCGHWARSFFIEMTEAGFVAEWLQ